MQNNKSDFVDIAKPTDFNDKATLGQRREIKEQFEKAVYDVQTLAKQPIIPEGFRLEDNGLFYQDTKICSRIDILGDSYSLTNNSSTPTYNWCKLVCFMDSKGNKQLLSIPMELFGRRSGEVIGLLLSHGLQIFRTKESGARLIEYLQNAKVSRNILSTPKVGWHENDYFVIPDIVIPYTDQIYFDTSIQIF